MKSKGEICTLIAMVCTLLFMAPMFIMLFKDIDQEWITLSIAPGVLACTLMILGGYISKLEHQLETLINQKKK